MGTISLSGILVAGPSSGGDVFPGSSFQVPLSFGDGSKQFGVATGILTQQIASPSAFHGLAGVGAGGVVTQGAFLYFKTRASMLLRLTVDDGAGGVETSVVPVQGIFVLEFSTSRPLELLEVQGSGPVEYFVSGAS